MAGKAEFQKAAPEFDETFDVVVVGYGFAGGVSAIQAARDGARVLLIEKMPDPGGISICSHGAICSSHAPEESFKYLKATNAGRTPDDVLRAFADGMGTVEVYFRDLAKICDAEIFTRERGGNYPLPGTDSFYYTQVEGIPNFDSRAAYPNVRGRPGGPMVFKILQDNIDPLPIEIRLSTKANSLITDVNRQVVGILIEGKDGERRVKARKGVILACGGFEANEEMKRQYWQMTPVMGAASIGNTGDGIRMAQELGAQLWHMWHFHGSYGFRHPDPDYPFAIRMKRFPDWIPGKEHMALVQTAWILVDHTGHRFMNELPPYVQDQGARPLELFDSVTQTFPRIPAHFICDEAGRRRYPMGNPTYNARGVDFAWSRDSLKEVELGILKKAATHRRACRHHRLRTGGAQRHRRALERDVRAEEGRGFRPARRQHDADRASAVLHRRNLAGRVQHAGRAGAQSEAASHRRQRSRRSRGSTPRANSAAHSVTFISPVAISRSASSPDASPVARSRGLSRGIESAKRRRRSQAPRNWRPANARPRRQRRNDSLPQGRLGPGRRADPQPRLECADVARADRGAQGSLHCCRVRHARPWPVLGQRRSQRCGGRAGPESAARSPRRAAVSSRRHLGRRSDRA